MGLLEIRHGKYLEYEMAINLENTISELKSRFVFNWIYFVYLKHSITANGLITYTYYLDMYVRRVKESDNISHFKLKKFFQLEESSNGIDYGDIDTANRFSPYTSLGDPFFEFVDEKQVPIDQIFSRYKNDPLYDIDTRPGIDFSVINTYFKKSGVLRLIKPLDRFSELQIDTSLFPLEFSAIAYLLTHFIE